jgi:hypothetical protein
MGSGASPRLDRKSLAGAGAGAGAALFFLVARALNQCPGSYLLFAFFPLIEVEDYAFSLDCSIECTFC